MQEKFISVEKYFESLPPEARKRLDELRSLIKKTAPDAEELISYNMPAYKIYGRILVYMAAHKEHIGFYPGGGDVVKVFKDEIKDYFSSKGTLRFPLNKSVPADLVKKIVLFRIQQNLEKKKS